MGYASRMEREHLKQDSIIKLHILISCLKI